MFFRVTPQLMAAQLNAGARAHNAQLANLQRQVSSGIRVERPSDDPRAMAKILAHRAQDTGLETRQANIRTIRTRLDASVFHLREAVSIVTRAKQITADARQVDDRETLANTVDELLGQIQSIANARYGDDYLFAGTAVRTEPFVATSIDSQGRPVAIDYRGAYDRSSVAIGPHYQADQFYSGAGIFTQRQSPSVTIQGSTGAALAQGFEIPVEQGTLTVRQTGTTYAAGSGVAPGASTAADTVIGPSGQHVLTIVDLSGTGANGTVALNGAPAVNFTSGDTDLVVTGPNGEQVHLDMSAITPGFSGTVDITGSGTLSIDGGQSEVAINFSASQTVTNGQTGDTIVVNSTGIRQAGVDTLTYTGGADLFQTLIQLRDDLRNTSGLSGSTFQAAMTRRHFDLEQGEGAILRVIGEQAATLEDLESLETRAADLQLETQKSLVELEAADLPSLIVQLQQEQNLLEFTYAASVRLMDQSLLDFLR